MEVVEPVALFAGRRDGICVERDATAIDIDISIKLRQCGRGRLLATGMLLCFGSAVPFSAAEHVALLQATDVKLEYQNADIANKRF